MQNCFPVLHNLLESKGLDESSEPDDRGPAATCPSTSSSEEPTKDFARAVSELYSHLCQSKSLL